MGSVANDDQAERATAGDAGVVASDSRGWSGGTSRQTTACSPGYEVGQAPAGCATLVDTSGTAPARGIGAVSQE